MGKLVCWVMGAILLCQWCLATPGNPGSVEYRRIRSMEELLEVIIIASIYVAIEYSKKKLDNGYKCPVYCYVDHQHLYWEKDENKDEQEVNIQPAGRLYNPARVTGKEQSASSIRCGRLTE